jgi:hypothetical protein
MQVFSGATGQGCLIHLSFNSNLLHNTMEKTINGTPFLLNMSDVKPEDRGNTAVAFLASKIHLERQGVVLGLVNEKTGAEYLDMEDALVCLGTRLAFISDKKYPIELVYLDGAPLVGFLAPIIKMGPDVDGGRAVTVHNEMIDGKDMPRLDDREAQAVFFGVAALYASSRNT